MPTAAATPLYGGWHRHPASIVLLVIAVLLIVLAALWDWNWLKRPLERHVTAATGRSFTMSGPLDVELGRVVIVRAHDLSFANAAWSLAPDMARADLVRIEVPLAPWLRGERRFRRIDLVRPALLLERNARGTANWQFPGRSVSPRPGRSHWGIGELRVHEGLLDVRDTPLDTQLRLTVDSTDAGPGSRSVRLQARGTGRYRGEAFRLSGWADSPVALLDRPDDAFLMDVAARAGSTRGRVHGALQVPVDPEHFRVRLELSGNDLAQLYPLLGLPLPATPPYRLKGLFERDERTLRLHELRGRIGDSDVSGAASVELAGRRPLLRGDLVSSHFDLDDLGGLIGLPPGTHAGEAASPDQRAAARRRAAGTRLLPHHEYDLQKLASVDADVRLRAKTVDAGKWPVTSFDTRLRLRNSVLRLEPMLVGVAGGRMQGTVRLDASRNPIDAGAEVAVKGFDIAALWPDMQPPNAGRVNGTLDLRGRGNSVAAMLANADGSVQLGMGRGRFSNLLLELAGLDVAESLKYLLGKDRTVPLRCAYGVFDVEDGLVRTRALAFDTTDTVLFGSGKVNLDQETLALVLRPEPKDVSPLSLRGPLEIGGTLKDPKFRPMARPLLARAAAAVALYAIAPPAALLALIETGPGEDTSCHPQTNGP